MPDHDHELAIISDSGRTDYEFEAVGYVADVQLNDHDEVGDHYVKGHVNGGQDIIGFNTAPKGIAFGDAIGDYRLELDGQPVLPFHINMRTLRIDTPDPAPTHAPYELHVGGRIIGGARTESGEDTVFADGTRVRGDVGDEGLDEWYYSGCLLGIDSNQDLDVTVDGEQIPTGGGIVGNPPTGVVEY